MAYSYTAFTGNGSTTQYAVSFPYIRREHVAVTVAGVPSTFTWVNSSLIQMNAAPASGAAVRVYRTTPIDAPLVDFADGATLVAADLDINSRQSIYIQQELDDAQTDNLPNVIPNGNKGDITTSVGGTVWAINNSAVIEAKIGTGAVTEAKIGTGAVTEAKIGTGAVTEAKIGTGAVTSSKIADGTIIDADVNASASIAAGKLSFTQAGTSAVARTIDSKLKDVVSVKDFGAVGNGITDDTAALKAAATAALAAGARLWIPKTSSFYNLSSGAVDITLADGQGFVIESDGAELRQTGSAGAIVIKIACSSATTAPLGTNTFLVVRNLIIDGRGVSEQWAETVPANLKTVQGINTATEYVLVEHCRFRKIYGYGVNSSGAYQSEVRNCAFSEVGGHWYQNNAYDAFGDGVYHSRVKASGNVLISHCNIVGYSSNYSRIGCTFEYGAGYYNATIEHCLIQKYDRAIHIEESSQCNLTVDNCRVIDFRVGMFVFNLSAAGRIRAYNSYFQYGSGDYNGSQGWIVFNSSSTPAEFNSCVFTITSAGFVANAGSDVRYYDCLFDYQNVLSTLSNHTAWFEGCQFRNIVSPGGSHYFFSGTQRFRSCRFYGTANVAFNRNSGTNFEEVIDCISYGPALSLATLASSVEYSGVTPSSSQLSNGIRVTNGTTLYLPAFYNAFPNADGWVGLGSGSTQNAPRTFTASATTVPSAVWANLSKATLIVKFSDGSASYVMRPEMFWDPTAYGQGYYYANIKRSTSGTWVADGAVTTMGNPSAAGFQGTTSDSFTWTGTGGYAWVCQVLIIPRHLSTYIL